MGSDIVVIIGIGFQHASQMVCIEDEDMVEALAPYRADHSLDMAVLPRRMRPDRFVVDAHRANLSAKGKAISAVIIAHQKSWRAIPGEGFGDLLRQPLGRGMIRHLDMQDRTPSMAEHDYGVQAPEADRVHAQHIDCADGLGIVRQESFPVLHRPTVA